MDVIKTGLGISKTIRNAARLKEIIATLAKNGFDEMLAQTNLIEKIPNFILPRSQIKGKFHAHLCSWNQSLGYRLRLSFEELGPGFVKLGQMLATQESFFEKEFLEELKLLQNQVKPIPFDDAMAILDQNLPAPRDKIFTEIFHRPIGMASIGVVFQGRLTSGQSVVIKIRRPGVTKKIQTDFEILAYIVRKLEMVSQDLKYLGLSKIVQQLSENILLELDFNIESHNLQQAKKIFQRYDPKKSLQIPEVFQHFTCESVCVMSLLEGQPIADGVPKSDIDFSASTATTLEILLKSLLIDGFFHGDLHRGNILLLNSGSIGLLDFGMCGNLSKKNRIGLISMFYAMFGGHFDNLVYQILENADYEELPNINQMTAELKSNLSPYLGMGKQVPFTKLIHKLIRIITRHKVTLPQEYSTVIRSLVLLDDAGKAIDATVDIYVLVQRNIDTLASSYFSEDILKEEAAWLTKDIMSTMTILPRYMKWFLKDLSRKNFAWEVKHTGHEKAFSQIRSGISFLGFIWLSSILVLSGTLVFVKNENSHQNFPALSLVYWILASCLFFVALAVNRKPK